MKRALRLLAALALAFAGGVGAAGAASAAVTACPPGSTSYSPSGVCEMTVVTDSVCADDVPMLSYTVSAPGSSATTTTLTWINPTGDDVVLTGLPLSGSVRWPGARVNAAGEPVDWPGVVQNASGEWVAGGDFAWARGPVEARFEVNPTVVTTVTYPGAVGCAGPVTTVSNRLATTGSTVTPLLAGAGGLLVAGAAAVLVAHRRRADAGADA